MTFEKPLGFFAFAGFSASSSADLFCRVGVATGGVTSVTDVGAGRGNWRVTGAIGIVGRGGADAGGNVVRLSTMFFNTLTPVDSLVKEGVVVSDR